MIILRLITLICAAFWLSNSLANELITRHFFKLPGTKPQQADFSLDSQQIITLSGDHTLQIHHATNSETLLTIPTGSHQALTFVQHPSQPILMTGGADQTIKIWSMDNGQEYTTLRGHLGAVQALAMSSDGNFLVSGSTDGTIIVWNLERFSPQFTILQAHQKGVLSLDLNFHRQLFVSSGADGAVRLWKLQQKELLAEFLEHQQPVNAVQFHPNGQLVGSASDDGTVKLWDWRKKQSDLSLNPNHGGIASLQFDKSGLLLLLGAKKGMMSLWNLHQQEIIATLNLGNRGMVMSRMDPQGYYVLALTTVGIVQVWELSQSVVAGKFQPHQRNILAMALTSNGRYLVTSSLDKSIRFWNVQEQTEVRSYELDKMVAFSLAIAPNNKTFVTGNQDGSIMLWETQKGRSLASLKRHKAPVISLDYHPKEDAVVSISKDQRWLIWNLKKQYQTKALKRQNLTFVRFSPKGDEFLIGDARGSLQVWSFPQGILKQELKLSESAISSFQFHSSEPLVAVGDRGGQIHLVKKEDSYQKIYSISAHYQAVNGVFFTGDQQSLISISQDKSARVWNFRSGYLVRGLRDEEFPISLGTSHQDLIAFATDKPEVTLLRYSGSSQINSSVPLSSLGRPFVPNEAPLIPLQPDQDVRILLNQVLAKQQNCHEIVNLENMVFQGLLEYPHDLGLYHGLLQIALVRNDMQLLFLATKFGKQAEFDNTIYDYSQEIDIRLQLEQWNHYLFDQAMARRGDRMEVALTSCSATSTIQIDSPLNLLDLPHEFIEKVMTIPHLIDFQDFQGLSEMEFINRLFSQIESSFKRKVGFPKSRVALDAQIKTPPVPTGILFLNFQKTQFFGNPFSFQIRNSQNQWMTYTSDHDKQKRMLLPADYYYLKLNGKLVKAFQIRPNEEQTIQDE